MIFTQNGETALIIACDCGNTDIARMLLDHGAAIDHCDKVKDLEHVATHNNWSFAMYMYDLSPFRIMGGQLL